MPAGGANTLSSKIVAIASVCMPQSNDRNQLAAVPVEIIQQKIYLIRGYKVMVDSDLAQLYGVAAKRLNEQVKRNFTRFPQDFMFQLNKEEAETLRSQFATSKGGARRSSVSAAEAIEEVRRRQGEHSEQITVIIETINQMLNPEPVPPKRRIGFN